MMKPFRLGEMKQQFAKGMHSVPIPKPSSTAHHKSMGKQGEEDQENKSKKTTETPSKKKEVIINVYVESPSPPLPPIHVHQKGGTRDTCKKSKPFSKSTGGYDRRAQLLAYAKELRNGDSKQPQWPQNFSKPKHKMGGKSPNAPVRIQGTTRNRKRYRRLVPEVDISCKPKSITGRKKKKKKGNRVGDSSFVVRIGKIKRDSKRILQRLIREML